MLVDIKTNNFYSCLILTENFLGNIKTQNCLSCFHPNSNSSNRYLDSFYFTIWGSSSRLFSILSKASTSKDSSRCLKIQCLQVGVEMQRIGDIDCIDLIQAMPIKINQSSKSLTIWWQKCHRSKTVLLHRITSKKLVPFSLGFKTCPILLVMG